MQPPPLPPFPACPGKLIQDPLTGESQGKHCSLQPILHTQKNVIFILLNFLYFEGLFATEPLELTVKSPQTILLQSELSTWKPPEGKKAISGRFSRQAEPG